MLLDGVKHCLRRANCVGSWEKGCIPSSHKSYNTEWQNIKRTTVKFLGEAENEFDLIGAETIHSLSGRLLKEAERNMLEDSFAHKILDPIFETVFGSNETSKQDWANGFLLPSMKRKREEMEEEVCKPDWMVFSDEQSTWI